MLRKTFQATKITHPAMDGLKIQILRRLLGPAGRLAPAIPALWEAKAGGSPEVRSLRQENGLNPEEGSCSELRSRHCTPAGATRPKLRHTHTHTHTHTKKKDKERTIQGLRQRM